MTPAERILKHLVAITGDNIVSVRTACGLETFEPGAGWLRYTRDLARVGCRECIRLSARAGDERARLGLNRGGV